MDYTDAVIVPVILGTVEGMKRAGMPAKWSPVASIVLGILASTFLFSTGDWVGDSLKGIVFGLSASGLWSGTKAIMQ